MLDFVTPTLVISIIFTAIIAETVKYIVVEFLAELDTQVNDEELWELLSKAVSKGINRVLEKMKNCLKKFIQ